MDVVAMVANKATTLDAAGLALHIEAKANRLINRANSSSCANDIIGHPGGNAAGGALGGGISYKGAAVYHASRNFGGAAQGCSVFFCDAGGGHAKILAVGVHSGQAGPGHPTYDLDWVSKDWGASFRWQAGGQVTL